MGDPATIALNLTFFGTVFVAFVMFLGLFIVFVAMLLLAGVGRLLALVLMALFGRFPRNDTIEVVRLPVDTQLQASQTSSSRNTSASTEAPKAPLPVRAPRPPRDWKKLLSRAGVQEALRTAVEHHPLVTAARPVPPVLAKDWADAVAAADARAVARARAAAAPVIDAPVRDLPGKGPATEVEKVAPLVETALDHSPRPPLTRIPAPPSRAPGSKGAQVAMGSQAPASLAKSATEPPLQVQKPAAAGHMAILDTGSLVSLAQHTESHIRS
ncbi:hypothetical protein [Arthrobacter sp. ISL-28]|uniref:hypothetical protein n=1 Tax=Arthrobacter sp. ISL-28 TaxID=2819108 RepID=UPI001BE596CD|nr:hypothetical protein [Arthrobacter sp. ISL-28]MBT2522349.1 hypothetical protein [Arthrobacter sp. ISL-28]